MTTALVIISILLGIGGTLSLSNATAGMGIISLGILFAIFARIVQAAGHHSAMRQAIANALESRPVNPAE